MGGALGGVLGTGGDGAGAAGGAAGGGCGGGDGGGGVGGGDGGGGEGALMTTTRTCGTVTASTVAPVAVASSAAVMLESLEVAAEATDVMLVLIVATTFTLAAEIDRVMSAALTPRVVARPLM